MGRRRGGRRRKSSKVPIPATRNTSTSTSLPPKSWLYLFYAHSESSKWAYSLSKIDLHDQLKTHKDNDAAATPRNLSPILEFLNRPEYPHGMKCALLGSKFYFLGGEHGIDEQHPPVHHWQVFPRDVYEFEITTNGPLKKMDALLNTGKPGPFVFAAAGKIYALGSKICPNFSFDDEDFVCGFLPSIKLFEVFDPSINKWQVLNNPPVDEDIEWTGCNVLEQHQQVLITGWKDSVVLLVYYLQQDKWVRYADHDLSTILIALSSQEVENHDLVYGLPHQQAPVKMNLDILSRGKNIHVQDGTNLDILSRGKNVQVQDDGLVQISIPNDSSGTFTRLPYNEWNTRFLRYIGDGHFCYLVSGMLTHPNAPDCYGYSSSDPYARGITITLFKEIDHDDDNNIGGTKSEGEQLIHSFQAKILHSQEYVMRSSFYNKAKLDICFVVSPEQLKKL